MAKPAELGSDDILVRKGGARGVDPRDSDTPEVEAPKSPKLTSLRFKGHRTW